MKKLSKLAAIRQKEERIEELSAKISSTTILYMVWVAIWSFAGLIVATSPHFNASQSAELFTRHGLTTFAAFSGLGLIIGFFSVINPIIQWFFERRTLDIEIAQLKNSLPARQR